MPFYEIILSWWNMSVISALRRLRQQEDREFKTSLDYMVRPPSLKQTNRQNKSFFSH
jgi:hypothetical protein